MKTNKENQNKIVLNLMIIVLAVILSSAILAVVILGVNIYDSNLPLAGKIFLNLALILIFAAAVLPSFYKYFDKTLRILKIADELEKRANNLSEIINEITKIRSEAIDLKSDTKKLIAKNKEEVGRVLDSAKKKSEKRAIAKLEQIWKIRWEKKFVEVEKMRRKYESK